MVANVAKHVHMCDHAGNLHTCWRSQSRKATALVINIKLISRVLHCRPCLHPCFLTRQTPCRSSAPTLKGLVWSSVQCDAMRRQALLDCLSTMTGVCKFAMWARSSAFLAIDAAWRHKVKFCPAQHAQLQTLRDFVQGTRATVLKVRVLQRRCAALTACC